KQFPFFIKIVQPCFHLIFYFFCISHTKIALNNLQMVQHIMPLVLQQPDNIFLFHDFPPSIIMKSIADFQTEFMLIKSSFCKFWDWDCDYSSQRKELLL